MFNFEDMMGVDSFMGMMGTHEQRKVDTYEVGDLFVDTCSVTDSDQPFETAVAHPKYNDGDIVIVEMYDTKKQAQKGHDKWVSLMTSDKLPESLEDVSTSTIAKLCNAMKGATSFDEDEF